MNELEFQQQAEINVGRLNDGQRGGFDRIKDSVVGNIHQKLFFVDEPGGTDKSFVFNTLIGHLEALDKRLIVVASSGIAALILHKGRTAHSEFKIPILIYSHSTCAITLRSALAEKIRLAHLIIWDEAPMQHRHVFEAVDRTLRDIMRVEAPFGGKVVVFGGDFRQVLNCTTRLSGTNRRRMLEDVSRDLASCGNLDVGGEYEGDKQS
jgi:hypothetical protein